MKFNFIQIVGYAALTFFAVSLIGVTLGASTMGSVWLSTRWLDKIERQALEEAAQIKSERDAQRQPEYDRQSQQEKDRLTSAAPFPAFFTKKAGEKRRGTGFVLLFLPIVL